MVDLCAAALLAVHVRHHKPAAGDLSPLCGCGTNALCSMPRPLQRATPPSTAQPEQHGQPGTEQLHQPAKLSTSSTLPCRVSPYLHDLVGQPLVVLLLDANVAEVDVILAMGIKPSRDKDQVWAAGRQGTVTGLRREAASQEAQHPSCR